MTASVLQLPSWGIRRPAVRRLLSMRYGLGAQGSVGYSLGRGQASAAAGNGLLKNLVAYWPLNEAAGANNALDLHSNGLTLTQMSSPSADMGHVYTTARVFAGTNDYFTASNDDVYTSTGNVDFTLVAWMYQTVQETRDIFSKWNISSNREFALFTVSGIPCFGVTPDGLVTSYAYAAYSGSAPTKNIWHLVIASHDAEHDELLISIDNSAPDVVEYNLGVFDSTAKTRIGYRESGGMYWKGRLGPVAMWKSAAGQGGVLSAAQREALWNGGAGLAYSAFTA